MLMFFPMYFMLNPPVLMSLQEAPEIYFGGDPLPPLPLKKQICLGQPCTSPGSFLRLATGSEQNTVQNQPASKTHRRRLGL